MVVFAPVAQLDRASVYGTEGCRFEPCQVYLENKGLTATSKTRVQEIMQETPCHQSPTIQMTGVFHSVCIPDRISVIAALSALTLPSMCWVAFRMRMVYSVVSALFPASPTAVSRG